MTLKRNADISSLSSKIGLTALAVLITIAKRGATTMEGILSGPRVGIGKAYDKTIRQKTFFENYEKLRNAKENSLRTTIWRLQKKGLIQKSRDEYQISILGLKLLKMRNAIEIEQKSQWDGKWRLFTFDIPEKMRNNRSWLRFRLLTLEYKPIQKSVFLGKLPIPQTLFKEIRERGLANYIRLIVIGEIDDEKLLV